ncbi:hypothetical protein FLONG3_3227 [Fusarium longipes]|uniref:Small secreted n=1 Tax=Fusarium longipes TaxID=694270 RepID=A0A395T314_9HYPO|nr:hypothetical protein FLONG3_3227 [Fusarium longipes]
MKLSINSFAAATIFAGVASARLQVNYYWDGACQNYALSFNPTDGECYNYKVVGTNSAYLTNCDGNNVCQCAFYTESNCRGDDNLVILKNPFIDNHCASNGGGWASVQCWQAINPEDLPDIPI